MPAEKPSGLCDAHEQAAMIAADRESDTNCEVAGGHPLLHHLPGHYPVSGEEGPCQATRKGLEFS
ncbi:hypothetical protein LNKW23_45710 [Paralimibaculum aggregatum]|uniref:Uncharacterized protein n=1 Tax=Paralimibaculum aggregatum TaxID=3036245 RepID=A0ABQ6LTF9_9RHOB|nr:hypothetical protein LNKW23_45710 [Limibaculum sp. NKW23]